MKNLVTILNFFNPATRSKTFFVMYITMLIRMTQVYCEQIEYPSFWCSSYLLPSIEGNMYFKFIFPLLTLIVPFVNFNNSTSDQASMSLANMHRVTIESNSLICVYGQGLSLLLWENKLIHWNRSLSIANVKPSTINSSLYSSLDQSL